MTSRSPSSSTSPRTMALVKPTSAVIFTPVTPLNGSALPLFKYTRLRLLRPTLPATTSRSPSPSMSPSAMARVLSASAVIFTPVTPLNGSALPLFKYKRLGSPKPKLPTITSRSPSPSTSPTAMARVSLVSALISALVLLLNGLALPLFNVSWLVGPSLPAMTSRSPSPSTSPSAMASVKSVTVIFTPTTRLNGAVLPLFKYSRLVSMPLPTTTSRSPSPSTSPRAMPEVLSLSSVMLVPATPLNGSAVPLFKISWFRPLLPAITSRSPSPSTSPSAMALVLTRRGAPMLVPITPLNGSALPLFKNNRLTIMFDRNALPATISRSPSPSTSPNAMACVLLASAAMLTPMTPLNGAALPLFKYSRLTLSLATLPALPSIRSRSPSPSISPSAMERVKPRSAVISTPVTSLNGSALPLFKYKRLVSKRLPAMTSRSPSPSTSPSAMARVTLVSAVMLAPVTPLNGSALPLFKYNRLGWLALLPTTISRSPSPSTSPTAMAFVRSLSALMFVLATPLNGLALPLFICNRLVPPETPSMTSRSPSPSISPRAMATVPAVAEVIVSAVMFAPVMSSNGAALPLFKYNRFVGPRLPAMTSRSPSPSTSPRAMARVSLASSVMLVPVTPLNGAALPLFKYKRLGRPLLNRGLILPAITSRSPSPSTSPSAMAKVTFVSSVILALVTPLNGSALPLFKYNRLVELELPSTTSRSPSPSTSPKAMTRVSLASAVIFMPATPLNGSALPLFKYKRLVVSKSPATISRSPSLSTSPKAMSKVLLVSAVMSTPVTPLNGVALPLFKYMRLVPRLLPTTTSRSPSLSRSPSAIAPVESASSVMLVPTTPLNGSGLPLFKYSRLVRSKLPMTTSR